MSYESQSEGAIEKILTRDDVMEVFARSAKNFRVSYEQFDQYGPVLLDVEVVSEAPGETVQYQYMRKGDFSGQPERSATTIHVVFYKDGIPTTGYNLAEYDEDSREWKELNKPE